MEDYRYKLERTERHERVGRQTTVKQTKKDKHDWSRFATEVLGIPSDVVEMFYKLEYSVEKAVRDANENKGRGGMTQAADCVRDTRNEAKLLREKYDKKYL